MTLRDVCQRRPNKLDQLTGSNRLVKQLANPEAGCAPPEAAIKPSRDQYCRDLNSLLSQTVDDVQTADAGHVMIDDQAARPAASFIVQKLSSRGVQKHLEPEAFEQCLQRVGDWFVVINDANRLLKFAGRKVAAREGHTELLKADAPKVRISRRQALTSINRR